MGRFTELSCKSMLKHVLTIRVLSDIMDTSEVMSMPLTAKEAIRRLRREGWREVRQVGSHKQFIKDGVRLTVPDHPGDLKPGVEKDIRRKAGW